jgi:hypothetical protein
VRLLSISIAEAGPLFTSFFAPVVAFAFTFLLTRAL